MWEIVRGDSAQQIIARLIGFDVCSEANDHNRLFITLNSLVLYNCLIHLPCEWLKHSRTAKHKVTFNNLTNIVTIFKLELQLC